MNDEEREEMEMLEAPYIPNEIIEYLKKAFNIHYCIGVMENTKNASEAIGFIKGVMEVINHLDILNAEMKGD